MKTFFTACMLSCAVFFLNAAQAVEVAGVKVEETTQASNTTLKLNGAGVRKKLFFKVYVAALYATETKKKADEFLAVPGPKKMQLTLTRDITSETLSQAFIEGMKKNTDELERAKLADQIQKFSHLFLTIPELKIGDVIGLEWVPDVGTVVSFNGKKLGDTLSDMAFFNALMRIWLGNDPVDVTLKNQLLGGA